MSSPPPTKPPRGVKQGKETSGLLMSVIRTLSASETNEQREKERAKLEKEYKKSDARLDELVAAHAQEMTDVMQKFSAVSSALSAWGQHCAAAEARLGACRALLRVRRDDLRRLWADARTHHHALRMLTDIERVVVSEREARELTSAGRVLAAAQALQAALLTARTELPHVHALSATTAHLEAKKKELVDIIVRRISEAVYRDERAPLSRRVSARRRTALLLAELTKSEEVTDAYLQDITPEFEASLTEEDKTFETNVMISLEALGVLEQLKEATEKFKVQIQNELLEVIDSVSRRIIDDVEIEADIEGEEDGDIPEAEGVTEMGRPLARLVNCLAEEFKACGTRNKRLLQLWRAALQKHRISEQCLHTEQHYWSAVQQVMQLLLTEYLEIESVNLAAQRSSGNAADSSATELRLSDYFAKKRPQRRRDKLFKLTAATPPPDAVVSRRQRYPLVCRPQPALLHAVLPALHALCAHLERPGGGECSLRAFISDYVRWGESERLSRHTRALIDAAMRAPSAWRERSMPPDNTVGHRPVFTCCLEAWNAIRECAVAARRCGSCGGSAALRVIDSALEALAAQCRAAHAKLAPGAPARAARWLADDDIVRFLKALPNYRAAIEHTEYTDKELKQAYEREAEILGTSLGDGEVAKREIVADINTLVDLALLCESMDWLSTNIKTIPAIASAPSGVGAGLKLNDKFHSYIAAAAGNFEAIAHKCLLFLHLEMRIECFHYLGQEEKVEGSESSEQSGGAGGASRLAHRLLAFHEHASALLADEALAYIMSGVGEMMSAAVVWRWQSEAGAAGAGSSARLAALRHCLAALSLPHDGLHAAHAYLHLLACTPEEIITSVREKGPQFSELEYLNAFKVIGARRGLSPADMRAQLKQLSAALGHVGVTV
ncbi:exocyst complex component 4 isoform X1 [Maniola jurtina]|uniref:exocyst complex component 4 isoform X1 n=1 Tax=Maniola jurtina TaxID=191418 RepID=UPI001E686E16|nr:exocyst complex component 4 isoform X1 [Maniola jurtina]XP_045764272.1 exocyst complex component 4 isoform X1 [Maniola jurtina]